MNNNYKKAYTEVLKIIKYLPKEELEKIPKEEIEFYKQNCDKEYKFIFDISRPLEEQKFLQETNAIIVTLFRDYFATESQKEKLQKILLINEKKYQEDLRKKYNPDDIFKKQEKNCQEQKANTQLIEVKEQNVIQKIFRKIINWIKSFI